MTFDKFHNTFIELTSRTYPHGTENQLDISKYIKNYTLFDTNVLVTIGESRTIFTSHLDTYTTTVEKVNHNVTGDIISTDGTTILGADDKAGFMVMLYMIEKGIHGNYIFFTGEERSGKSSKRFVEFPEKLKWLKSNIDRVVAFDRGGYDEIATSFFGADGCSKSFAKRLISNIQKISGKEFKMIDGGFCDATSFIDFVPECINLSVGYFNEHTTNEYVDMSYLYEMSEVYSKVDWEILVPRRTPKPLIIDEDMTGQTVSVLDYEELMLADDDFIYGNIANDRRILNRILHTKRKLIHKQEEENERSVLG